MKDNNKFDKEKQFLLLLIMTLISIVSFMFILTWILMQIKN
jgi:hypothetical protein